MRLIYSAELNDNGLGYIKGIKCLQSRSGNAFEWGQGLAAYALSLNKTLLHPFLHALVSKRLILDVTSRKAPGGQHLHITRVC
jgi:hypothetical protein